MGKPSGTTRTHVSTVERIWPGAMLAMCVASLAFDDQVAHAQCAYGIEAVIRGPECEQGGVMAVTALELNELGQVVGYVEGCPDTNVARLPFVWEEELGLKLLPMPNPIEDGEARAINNVPGSDGLGAIACTLNQFGAQGERAFRYDDGTWTILPPPFGFSYSAAHGINDAGQIVGSRLTPNGLLGFRWDNGVFTDIMFGLGNNPLPLCINLAGHAAGELALSQHAFKWDGTTVSDLGTVLGGDSAFVRRINNSGEMTGGAMVSDGPSESSSLHAFVLAGSALDIGVPDGFDASMGIDINNAGQVLVRATIFFPRVDFRTFIWQHGEMQQLDELVFATPDIIISHAAEAINDHGQIITTGWENGHQVALLLSPTPMTADVNLDCAVDFLDLLEVLEHWGPCPDGVVCSGDVVSSETFQPPGDGTVDGADLAYVLGNWSPEPPMR